MATVTPNYSWPVPTSSDLVKDGATAIEALGDAADATVKSVADGRGLVHINTTNFSGVTSQSVSDVFSSTYANYRIVFRNTGNSGAVSLRMRVSGADDSTTNYAYIRGSAYSDTGPTWVLTRAQSATSWESLQASDNASTAGYSIDIYGPNLATTTVLNALTNGTESSTPIRIYTSIYTGLMRLTTQFTGFTFIAATANGLTGSVSVYGYRL